MPKSYYGHPSSREVSCSKKISPQVDQFTDMQAGTAGAIRTEVSLPGGLRAVIHKDFAQLSSGLPGDHATFTEIEVVDPSGAVKEKFELTASGTVGQEYYEILHRNKMVGQAYGARVDLAIAAKLTGTEDLKPSDSVILDKGLLDIIKHR